ncbi:MAG: PH domain-containing protein [Candidatus Gribaldobacteria bacterium]|nr:PH domain-containing protein [Candidatus Gribaldobacteria bacterium]
MITLNISNKLPKIVNLYLLIKILFIVFLVSVPFIFIPKNVWHYVFWLIFIFIGLPSYISIVLDFKYISFIVEEGRITIKSGIIAKHSKTILFNNVQNVENTQGILARIFGLVAIKIWTASSQNSKTDNRADGTILLKKADAEWLKNFITKK